MDIANIRKILKSMDKVSDKELLNTLKQGFEAVFTEEKDDVSEDNTKKLIEYINEDIQGLYTAVIQYNNHAALIEGAEWMAYVTDLQQHTQDDAGQATLLADKVAYYGGVPTLKINDPKTAKTSREMIEQDEQLQRKNASIYRSRVEFCKSIGESAMEHIYLKIAEHEEEHHNTTLSFLGMKK